jgi:hypothetical protein
LVIDPKRIFRKQNFDEREWFETEKIWIDYQYDLAQRKLRGGVSLESWETWEGLRKWIFELENRGRKYQVPYYLVSDGVLADGKFCGEIALDSAEITQKQADFINQIQQELIRRKNKKEKTWIKGGKNNERLVLVTSEFVKVFSPCINI